MHHNLKITLVRSGLVHTVFGNIVKIWQAIHQFSVLQSRQHKNFISPVGTQKTAANWNLSSTLQQYLRSCYRFKSQTLNLVLKINLLHRDIQHREKTTVCITICLLLDIAALSVKPVKFPSNRDCTGLLLDELALYSSMNIHTWIIHRWLAVKNCFGFNAVHTG